jgi:hydrogenase maturation protease
MKPVLVIGVGNTLMGDDGIGVQIAAAVASDPRLPETVEVIRGGTDVLLFEDQMQLRDRVILIDAVLGDKPVGTVERFEPPFPELENRQLSAHHLSVPAMIGLLQLADPWIRTVRFTVVAINIHEAEARGELSPALSARFREIVDTVMLILEEPPPEPQASLANS